jgi:hypothetical protein
VKGVGAIVDEDEAVADLDVAGLEIEELIDSGAVGSGGMGGMRLVSGTVGVVDEVDGGVVDFEIAEEDARAPEAQDADAGADAIDSGVRGFAGSFRAVEDDSVGFGIEAEEMPVEGSDLGPAASALLEQVDHALSNEGFKGIGGSPEKEADNGSGGKKRDEAGGKQQPA